MMFLIAATVSTATAIAIRWYEVGYGPFLTLYEILLSNVFSLALIVSIAYGLSPATRYGTGYSLLVILILLVWALVSSPDPGQLPATFESIWLWLHVGLGKVFLGTLLVAFGLAIAALAGAEGLNRESINESAWQYASFAFVFDGAMLLSGAIWAHDAWGRYWNWDPVETWALVTWLTLGLCLHARRTWRVPQRLGWIMIVGVFVLAFLTLFGMPFLSLGPHKGIL